MDLRNLDDAALADHLNKVLAEQERRANLAAIPAQVASLSATYQAGGGNVEDLRSALT